MLPIDRFEAFGLVVIDAMLRGIPVIASTSGGLPEAKLGVDFIVPVTMVSGPSSQEVPQQDIRPWKERCC